MIKHVNANFDNLLSQASHTAEKYFADGVDVLDRYFGNGYAKAHPELLAVFMQVAAADFNCASSLKVKEEVADGLEIALGEISQAVTELANSVQLLGEQ